MKYKNISEAFTDAMQNEQSYDKKLDPILEGVFYESNNFSKFTDSLLEAVFDEICKKHDIPKYSSQKISQKKL